MGQYVANVDAAEIIAYIDDQPVFVAANIKHRPPLPEETGQGKILADCSRAAIALQPDYGQPSFQWAFRIGMSVPKRLQPLPGNHVHLSLFSMSYEEEEDRVSRLFCQAEDTRDSRPE
jgi:hypothetical protein